MIAKRLKNAILDAAFKGSLTEQLVEDGDSHKYYIDAKNTIEKLNSKIKVKWNKSLKGFDSTEDMIDIPSNWCWVKLGQIYYNLGQKKPDKEFTYIDIASINNKFKVLGDLSNIISPSKAPSRARKIVKKGDLIYSTVRPYLHNIAYIESDISPEPIASTGFAVVSAYNDLTTRYLYYYFQSPIFDKYANDSDNSRGVAYPAINNKKFDNAPIALPPLAEQKRIVEKLDQILPMIDALEKDEIKLDELMDKFPDNMKTSILQAAMQGKLTEQNQDEQVKIAKKYIEFNEDIYPFDIPRNWVFAKHNSVINISGGSQPPKSTFATILKPDYIRLYQIRDYGDSPVPVYIPLDKAKKKTEVGDILIARYGGSLGKIFRAKEGAYNVAMTKATPVIEAISKDYLFWFYNSPLFQKLIIGQTRSAQAGFNKKNLEPLMIPIPPLAEQERIVEKLQELLPIIDSLVKQI